MNPLSSSIAVLGAGAWGTAIAILLARNGNVVHLWDNDADRLALMQLERQNRWALENIIFPENLIVTKTLEETVKHIQDICLVVPSHAFRSVLNFLKPLVKRFSNQNFQVDLDSDMIGVQLCGVAKNVMAIATGISDGLGFGANTRSVLMTRGLAEISALCIALGGEAKTVMSLAGVGDLVLTCTDNQSRNRRFGLSLAKGASIDTTLKELGQAVEGYFNARQLYELAKKHQVIMPIAEAIYKILYEHHSPQSLLNSLNSHSTNFILKE